MLERRAPSLILLPVALGAATACAGGESSSDGSNAIAASSPATGGPMGTEPGTPPSPVLTSEPEARSAADGSGVASPPPMPAMVTAAPTDSGTASGSAASPTAANGGSSGAGDQPPDAAGSGAVEGAGIGDAPGEGGSGGISGQAGMTPEPDVSGPFCNVPATLREAGDCTGRLVGAALGAQYLSQDAYVAAAREHSAATPENEMKWDTIQPSRGQFNFGPADQIVDFALQNDMVVKGHALAWHNQLPAWVQALDDADEVRAVLLDHIATVMDHFQGRVYAWDVVNEVWQNEDTWVNGEPALRDYVFPNYLGEGFIDEAFIAARQADPDAKLYYNDYRAEGLNAKSDAIYEMVRGLVERGVPIDGVGLQMHQGAPNGVIPVSEIVANMQRIADLGLEVLLSEMDVHVCGDLTIETQAEEFHAIVAACVAQPACPAVTFWGVTDRYSWLLQRDNRGCAAGQDPAGLLWDQDYQKKPAYDGVMNALTGR